MADEGKRVFGHRPPRVEQERLNRGPSAADLREIPAATAADWENADLPIPIDEDTYREFRAFLAQRRKNVSNP